MRAIMSSPPKPRRAMVCTVARTTSAARRIGGVGFTLEPAVLACGSAERSQLSIVLGHTRKALAAWAAFQPRRFLISVSRKRWVAEKWGRFRSARRAKRLFWV